MNGQRFGMLMVEAYIESEKPVKRHILKQTRRNGDDIAAVKTRLSRVEDKVDGLDRKVGGLDRKVDGFAQEVGGVKHTLNGLIRDLPKMLSDAVRGGKDK